MARIARRSGCVLAAAGIVLLVIFWRHGPGGDAGIQHWLAIQTGTVPPHGTCDQAPGCHYGFWSGFGSVFPWAPLSCLGIFAGVTLWYRRNNCPQHWCWRLGHHDFTDPATGVTRKLCWRHHPHVARHWVTAEDVRDIERRLHLYLGKQPGKG